MSIVGSISGLTGELRRRHVIRVTVAYSAAGWVVAEASSTLLPALGVPYWSVSLVTVLLLLGLPIAVVLAWAYDITPAGVVRTPASARAVGAAAVAPAVAVLPFTERTGDAGAAGRPLGAGITEELIGALAQQGVRVVSRAAAAALQSPGAELRALAADTGITHLVEGSIGSAGGRLRVAVRLVGADGFTMWSSTYERDMQDLFDVQRQIAQSVLAALRPALLPRAAMAVAHGAADSEEAWLYYLRGRQQWETRTPESVRAALDSFARAASLDRSHARAHAGIADCWAILVDYGVIPPSDGLPRARAAAEQALRLDPLLAEALTSAALIAQLEWRWADAETGFRAALEVNPAYQVARQRLALLLGWLGRTDEARAEAARALRADPLSPVIAASLAWIEYFARRYDDAIERARGVLRDHDAAHARVPLALALTAAGRAAEAIELLAPHAWVDDDAAPPLLGTLALALGAAGRSDEARAVALRIEALAAAGHAQPCALAQAWLGAGDAVRALDTLERAAGARAPQLIYLPQDPALAVLRDEPRFCAILQLMQVRD